MSKANIKAVIFDLDGLLIDSEPIYKKGIQKVLDQWQLEYTKEVYIHVIGKDENLGAQEIVTRLNLPIEPKELLRQRNEFLQDLFPESKALPAAEKLTTHLKNNQIPIIVATSSEHKSVDLKLKNHKEWFDPVFGSNIITGDNPAIKQAKPSPDIFLEAAKILNIDPKDCLVFEDSHNGAIAGFRANMKVVAVPDIEMLECNKEIYEANSFQILKSLEEFVPEEYGLPPY